MLVSSEWGERSVGLGGEKVSGRMCVGGQCGWRGEATERLLAGLGLVIKQLNRAY